MSEKRFVGQLSAEKVSGQKIRKKRSVPDQSTTRNEHLTAVAYAQRIIISKLETLCRFLKKQSAIKSIDVTKLGKCRSEHLVLNSEWPEAAKYNHTALAAMNYAAQCPLIQ